MRILCVDDDYLSLNALKVLLQPNEVIIYTNPLEAIEFFRKEKVDIVILDIRMPQMNGVEVAKKLREINQDIKIILLSTFIESSMLKEIIQHKINGYLLKTNPEGILKSIHSVMNHQSVFDDTILPTIHFEQTNHYIDELSEIENKIVQLIAKGYNNQEIAQQLSYSLGTIRNYVSNILEVLQLRDRTQLVVYYYTKEK